MTTEVPISPPAAAPPAPVPRCRCGYDKRHPMVSHQFDYPLRSWLLVSLLGITRRPSRVKFWCCRCNVVFDSTTDPKVLDSFA